MGAPGLLPQRTGTGWRKLGIKRKSLWKCGYGGGASKDCHGLRLTPKGRAKCVPSVQKDAALPGSQPRIPQLARKPQMQTQLYLVFIFLLLGAKVCNIDKRLHCTDSYTASRLNTLAIHVICLKTERASCGLTAVLI